MDKILIEAFGSDEALGSTGASFDRSVVFYALPMFSELISLRARRKAATALTS